MLTESADRFLDALEIWAARQPAILAVAVIGSHARGTARPDSDVDVIAIVDDPTQYLKTSTWLEHFGNVRSVSDEDWGSVQSKRVHYADGVEVEFGITDRKWAGTGPVDPGTRRVISDGIRVLYDPEGMLGSLLMVCLPKL
jgi:uncharacterized protein